MRNLYFVIYLYILNALLGVNGSDASRSVRSHITDNNTTLSSPGSSHQREKKVRLIKKFLKKTKKREGYIRLVEGLHQHEGNVEVLHSGVWGNVCDDEWDEREASVVCSQLGYNGTRHKATHNSRFGPARRKFLMDNVYCTGDEKQLTSCRFDGWGTSDCEASEAAGVVCNLLEEDEAHATTPATITTTSQRPRMPIQTATSHKLELRLTGGRVSDEGRVEVKFGEIGKWGLICGDGWSMLEAMVVCRQLGFGYANAAIQTDFFGGRNGSQGVKMILSGVQCQGTEKEIDTCLHDQINNVECPGTGDNIAAVVCTQALADLVIDHYEIMRSTHLEDRQLYFLQCAMEENCLASNAYRIQRENTANWHLETRRLLRFTATIHNVGTADFRPFVPKHLWQFHQCHMHYHSMEIFATFDVLDGQGKRVAEGHKASFCLEDNKCLPDVKPSFACANYGDQGISAGCSDIYRHNIDCQWVDISELVPGMYTFKVAVNPDLKIAEQTFENNAAVCNLLYTETFAHVFNCSLQRP